MQTDQQKHAALAKGRQVRTLRAHLRDRMAQDAKLALRVVEGTSDSQDFEDVASGMRVDQLVRMVPGIGPMTSARVLHELGISRPGEPRGGVRMYGLTWALRQELADVLRDELGHPRPVRTIERP